ncbi:hypothetical protein Sru01_10190 [Sphaerisporangium rufum]|uniref:DUF541 domain-containing protein n=1 Tax=Sphaerisporangium rufum TaxID=1381558 RepID=A0A919QXZ1_9ACTN|nr:SIMPL domain-containing protein [Sphaerisporangium rufum]GII76037.1 hypothetical protein Sru01_10190 [Sphaerisporangium rufum]
MIKLTVVPAATVLVLLAGPVGPASAAGAGRGASPSGPAVPPIPAVRPAPDGPRGAAGSVAHPPPAADRNQARRAARVTVGGTGKVEATPDLLRLNVGVEARAPRAGDAFTAVKEAARRLTVALLAAGVAESDLRTTDLSLVAEYDKFPRLSGYRANQSTEVVVRDLARTDAVLAAVASAGDAARLNGLSFDVAEPEMFRTAARAAAYQDALNKARQYATLTGRRLARLARLEEDGDASPSRYALVEKSGGLSPGRQSIVVTVRAVFELR